MYSLECDEYRLSIVFDNGHVVSMATFVMLLPVVIPLGNMYLKSILEMFYIVITISYYVRSR